MDELGEWRGSRVKKGRALWVADIMGTEFLEFHGCLLAFRDQEFQANGIDYILPIRPESRVRIPYR